MAAVLGSCLGLLLSRGALAPAEVKERVPLADSVCWSSQSAVRQFGSLAVCSLPFLRLAVWKISPFRRLIPRGSFPNSSATRFGDLATFRRFFQRFFPKRGTKRRTVPKVNVLSTLRRQSRRSVRIEPSYRRATPPRASIRSRLTVPAVRVGSERRGHVLILEGSSERSLAEKPKATTCHQRAGTWSPSFRTPARRIPGLSLRSGSASSRLTIRARETTPRRFDAR